MAAPRGGLGSGRTGEFLLERLPREAWLDGEPSSDEHEYDDEEEEEEEEDGYYNNDGEDEEEYYGGEADELFGDGRDQTTTTAMVVPRGVVGNGTAGGRQSPQHRRGER